MRNMNMIKFPYFFKSQSGVPGGDTADGFRLTTQARTIYTDPAHPLADDNNDGTDPNAPKATIAGGIAAMAIANGGEVGDELILAAYDYEESVSVNLATHPSYCTIRGEIDHRFRPQWSSAAVGTPALILGCVGWIVESIRFICPTGQAAVVIPNTQAPYTADDVGIRTHIRNCYFDGQTTGLYGIDLHGAPYNVQIQNCLFQSILNAGNTATGIVSTNTGFADARAIKLLGCHFQDNDNHVNASFNDALIKDNTFNGSLITGVILDLRGGTLGENMVVDNYFGGDYSNTGGYYANAANPGNWVGNYAQDVAEAEVGDNGITVAVPAA